ncbi:sushi, von Willebrand factor type A, EGF and pentraxin domain-containing protein 1 isoform X3 [Trematomus bernacchii]|uniref:sushi, von Willebrand factor type A, EGF and pentraxin domain-containing protein 1 isoform X3 n=1 Tax=Trematomus bernacchii TaxID=40690 RepID=UPI00146D711C|nr:sushi, von Willebrand factor type A, EGF and pentraxin domain-containing protein 1 isoform X3 [Trematomus bernacchii]
MEDRNTAMIVLLLLCVTAEMQVDGLSLDVCASCHPKATCDDKSDGSGKVCNCKYGFVGNGRTYCQDKDECQIGASKICGLHTDCHNTQGSYFCTCRSGFTPSNNMDVFTPNDGTHCRDIDECTGTVTGLCGEGGQCRNLEGSFDCSCILGYEVQNGAEPFHPHRDKASCKVVDCGPPEAAEDTVLLSVSGTTYGSAAMFVCEEGFVWRRGNNRSMCEADGLWRGGNMSCEEVNCGPPPAAPHSLRLWDQSSRPGSGAIYQCNSGYHNVGKGNVSKCNAAGEWERPPLLCKDIDECTVTGVCGEGGQCRNLEGSFDCRCILGYEVQNAAEPFHPHRDKASCKVVDCGRPEAAEDTVLLSVSGTTYGSAAMFVCEEGFVWRRGNNRSVCEADGLWRGGNMSCEEVNCGPPPAAPHSLRLWDQSSRPGSRAIYQCNSGYHNVGKGNVSKCNAAGEWERPPLLCKDIDECTVTGLCGEGGQCRNLEGSFDCRCILGYEVQNGAEPFHPHRDKASCKVVDCGRPEAAEDTVLLSVSGTTYGSVAMFVCEEGFVWRRGNNRSVCEADGLWRGGNMSCEEVNCGPPPAAPHSLRLWDQSSRPGSRAIYQCNSGYHNVGKGNVSKCNAAGEWERPPLLCKEILCGSPPIIESTVQVWDGSSAPSSRVLFVCREGFKITGGDNSSICGEHGQWSSPTLTCQEISCGDPPSLPLTERLWRGSSTRGSTATYVCKTGFNHKEGNNISLCTSHGDWTKPNISCKEVECGVPAQIPHSEMLWDKSSSVGSLVVYQCVSGYGNVGEENVSVCTARGEWEGASLQCEAIRCGEPVLKAHAAMLWDGSSHVGSVVSYRCEEGFHSRGLGNSSLCGEEGEWEDPDLWCEAKCGLAPVLDHSEVVWHNRSVVVHRCEEGYHSWRGSNVSECDPSGEWRSATLTCIEIKPPVNHLRVLKENCVQWRAEKYEEDTETYKVTYTGSRDYQRSFQDKRKRFLSSKADELQLCLNLLPVTNYSISITAASSRFTASITTNTSLTVLPALAVDYREFETPVPTLRLRRSPNTLDPISVYQVFVLPVDGIMMFDCSSPASSDPKSKSSAEYITGQFDVQHVGTEMNFTVGDGLLYGGFFNAPLQSGRSYYIILRAVSQWKSAFKSSCVVWARVTGTSYVLRVSSLSAVAAVGLVAFVIIGGYSFCWFFKRT